MLEMRPNCERCDCDLPADKTGAQICTFECTFCDDCALNHFDSVCPNCGGDYSARPTRVGATLEKFPASTRRVVKDHG